MQNLFGQTKKNRPKIMQNLLRPKKIICMFTVTCQKNLGLVSRDNFFSLFFIIGKTGNIRSRFRNPIFHFRNFWQNDELCSFSIFFALNFDKKLAVE